MASPEPIHFAVGSGGLPPQVPNIFGGFFGSSLSHKFAIKCVLEIKDKLIGFTCGLECLILPKQGGAFLLKLFPFLLLDQEAVSKRRRIEIVTPSDSPSEI